MIHEAGRKLANSSRQPKMSSDSLATTQSQWPLPAQHWEDPEANKERVHLARLAFMLLHMQDSCYLAAQSLITTSRDSHRLSHF